MSIEIIFLNVLGRRRRPEPPGFQGASESVVGETRHAPEAKANGKGSLLGPTCATLPETASRIGCFLPFALI